MHHPSRGGVRGGKDQFEWESVKTDKHRENYLGIFVISFLNILVLENDRFGVVPCEHITVKQVTGGRSITS